MTETIDGARWSREELEGAYQNWYKTINEAASGQASWEEFLALYTDDVVYHDQIQGDLEGRESVRQWASMALDSFPGDQFRFPEIWHAIDETQGLVIAQIKNEMVDPGDGVVAWEPHISVMTYAGEGRFSAQTDAYDVESFLTMIKEWGTRAMKAGFLDAEQRGWYEMVYPETVPDEVAS
ncbi:nuclear transport factor 2 family protein [Microbacterium sp. NPDC056044]|uniref:nuclear transport factor 2 family protein n=1 Tax=Microbacterium sp. NPDC056044 TaxID=3345690 RepID=UPI0035E1FDA2